MKTLRALLVAALVVAACSSSVELAAPRVVVPDVRLGSVLWFDGTQIASNHIREDPGTAVELVDVDDGSRGVVDPPSLADDDCDIVFLNSASRRHDSDVGLIVVCRKLGREDRGDHATLARLDPRSGDIELMQPIVGIPVSYATTAWDPSDSTPLIGTGGAICGGLRWVAADGSVSAPAWIVDNGQQRFALDDPGSLDRQGDCAATGRAAAPTWSADGSRIAFLASPESVGRAGRDRTTAHWAIVLAEPDAVSTQILLDNIAGAASLDWSLDGTRLAFTGRPRGRDEGAWVIDVASAALTLVARGEMQSVSWSPDGREVAIVRDTITEDALSSEILVATVPD